MRIVWLTKKYLDVAVDRSTWLEMVRCLSKRGHEVKLVTTYYKTRIDDAGLGGRVVFLPTIKMKVLNHLTFSMSAFAYLSYCVVRDRPDVLIADTNSALVALPFNILSKAGLIKTKFVLDIRTIPVELVGLTGRISQLLFNLGVAHASRWFDGITVITPFMRRTLAGQFSLDEAKVGTWTSGFSPEHFDPRRIDPDDSARLRRRLGLDGRLVVVYHGTLTRSRGLREAVRACELIRERREDLALFIVGRGSARQELEDAVERLDLADMVVIADAVPYEEVPRYIGLADVGILPFPRLMWWRVSSPIKLMEYLAMGKPVIVTDIEAHREVLDGQSFGLFVDACDPVLIAEKFAQVLRLGRERLNQLGGAGRSLVKQHYTWDKQAGILEDYLIGLGAGRHD